MPCLKIIFKNLPVKGADSLRKIQLPTLKDQRKSIISFDSISFKKPTHPVQDKDALDPNVKTRDAKK